MNTAFRISSVSLDLLTVAFNLATESELRSGKVVVSVLRIAGPANEKLVGDHNIRTVPWTQPEGLSDEEVGPTRRHFLTERYSSTLLGFEAYQAFDRRGLCSELNHLKAFNNGEMLGPLFTFDKELLTIHSSGKRHEFVLGIRYDAKEGNFFPVAKDITAMHGDIAMQRTLALVH